MKSRAVFAFMAIATGCYYHWAVRAAGYDIRWERNANGYYNYLARGFAAGHLYLPVEPAPALLAQPDPWAPNVDDSLKLFDAVLYNRHYYLYHGAGPAVMLFAPCRVLSGRDMPENFALFLFCFGGYLFWCGALLGVLRLAGIRPAAWVLALLFLALGTCQAVPFLLNRVWVYEVAIGGGYFCLAAAVFLWVQSLLSRHLAWVAASGLMFGMAVSCRPHLAVAGGTALLWTGFSGRRRLMAFSAPLLLVGLGIASYNFARFGDPLEFGNRYLLGAANETEVRLRLANVPPGMYYLFLSRPEFTPVFPWVRMPAKARDFPHPPIYTVEPTTGALFLAPFLPGVLLIFFVLPARRVLAAVLASGLLVLVFLSATGWVTQRYEVDFLPALVFVAVAGCARFADRNRTVRGLLVFTIVSGTIVNLALGLAGPYSEMLKNRPARFVRIAHWFSPFAKYRPMLNPPIHKHVVTTLRPQVLFTAGADPYRYRLSIENRAGAPLLVSQFGHSRVEREFKPAGGFLELDVAFAPETGSMRVSGPEGVLIEHPIGALVTAPAEIE